MINRLLGLFFILGIVSYVGAEDQFLTLEIYSSTSKEDIDRIVRSLPNDVQQQVRIDYKRGYHTLKVGCSQDKDDLLDMYATLHKQYPETFLIVDNQCQDSYQKPKQPQENVIQVLRAEEYKVHRKTVAHKSKWSNKQPLKIEPEKRTVDTKKITPPLMVTFDDSGNPLEKHTNSTVSKVKLGQQISIHKKEVVQTNKNIKNILDINMSHKVIQKPATHKPKSLQQPLSKKERRVKHKKTTIPHSVKKITIVKKLKNPSIEMKKISNKDYVSYLNKANQHYKNKSYDKSIHYYEKIYLSNFNNQRLQNNLFYLYGVTDQWNQAQQMFSHKKEREVLNLIYSYGLGSIHHEYFDLETKFNHFLQHRRAVNLWLLIALSYEKNNQLKKATSSYKKAYKMRKNAYTTYAYARSLDLSKDHKHAIIVYQEFLQKYNQDTTMVGAIKNRLQYLHSLKKGHE